VSADEVSESQATSRIVKGDDAAPPHFFSLRRNRCRITKRIAYLVDSYSFDS
jgi:hypothetical protein